MAKLHLALCAWRIECAGFLCPGFTTSFEDAKRWVLLGATVTPLHGVNPDFSRAAGRISLADLFGRVQAAQIPEGTATPLRVPRRKQRGR